MVDDVRHGFIYRQHQVITTVVRDRRSAQPRT
jgi:hypothetical protein